MGVHQLLHQRPSDHESRSGRRPAAERKRHRVTPDSPVAGRELFVWRGLQEYLPETNAYRQIYFLKENKHPPSASRATAPPFRELCPRLGALRPRLALLTEAAGTHNLSGPDPVHLSRKAVPERWNSGWKSSVCRSQCSISPPALDFLSADYSYHWRGSGCFGQSVNSDSFGALL